MKKLLLILFCLPLLTLAQTTTSIPDANFEQALIDLGYDTGPTNGEVVTDSINTVTTLNVSGESIADLTGIEDFAMLDSLICYNNTLDTLDVSANSALTYLNCDNNQLDSLNVSSNLTSLSCSHNNLTSLDVSTYI